MLSDERFDFAKDAVLCHGQALSRVITRTSTSDGGDYTKLRDFARAPILPAMQDSLIDIEKLKVDMAETVERTSARKFSLAVTGGKNPDFYRNFINNGQDKRMSANVFVGIALAMGKNPGDYVPSLSGHREVPNAALLTSAFAVLLLSLGIDPYEDGKAQKLARQFPSVLQSVEDLHATVIDFDTRQTDAPLSADEDRQ